MTIGRNVAKSSRLSPAALASLLATSTFLWPGCKEEKPVEAVPVDTYIKKEDPPVYLRGAPAKKPTAVVFHDITEDAGISFTHVTGAFGEKWMPETVGGGGSFIDYDGDGRPDVLLVNSGYWPGHEPTEGGAVRPISKLYRNKGDGTFADASEESGLAALTGYGMGATAADYDGDGDQDIYITAVGRNTLLRNDGGKFIDVTDQAGVGLSRSQDDNSAWEWSTGATWTDYDRDGDLDLLVCNYVQWTPETDIWTTRDGKTKAYATPEKYQGASNVLYRNDGSGTFTDVSQEAGVYNPDGKSLSVIADDFNDDGWPDLFISNDTQPNFLYMNQTDGKFTDAALTFGVAYDENGLARAGMGVDVADLQNSGSRCIGIGNFSGEPVSLYSQESKSAFLDRSGSSRLSRPTTVSLTFGLEFADFNLDGFEDLLLANGHIEPEIEAVREDWRFAQPPQLFLNDSQGRFIEHTDQAGQGFATPVVGRALCVADIDGDGDLDVLLTANGGKARLLRNDTAGAGNAVRLRLSGSAMNSHGIGACLKASVSGREQTQFVRTGGSYLSQSDLAVTFGLGQADLIEKLAVRWPEGKTEEFEKLAAGRLYTITKGAGIDAGTPFAENASETTDER
jgi:hypothetical protein